MSFVVFRPGMIMTAGRANDAAMIGATVFVANRLNVQSISSGADTVANALQWEEINSDLLDSWDAGSPTRWTAPRDGWFVFTGGVSFAASTGGQIRECCWYVNGALAAMGRARSYANTIASQLLTVEARTLHRQLAEGEYVELIPAHNAGAALDTATGSYRPYMAVTYAGPA